jgi:ABC-type dipeptide/oligopeptide/nickel transport system permease component
MATNGYLLRKSLQVIPTVLGVFTMVFLMVRLIPGDPASYIAGDNATPDQLEVIRQRLGLDEPFGSQYVNYLKNVVQLDFGRSLVTNQPVTDSLKAALPTTLFIGTLGLIITFSIAVPLGTIGALLASKGKGTLDQALVFISMLFDQLPGFWLALVLMLIFTLHLGWFGATGPMPWDEPFALAKRIAIPLMVLSIGGIASILRITRTSVLEILSEDYIRTARAMGTPDRSVIFKHALPNALLPVVTFAGLGFGRLLAGSIIIESIFALPGMGSVLLHSIIGRDYPIVQALVLIYALMFVTMNIVTDLVYTKVDPRVKL